MLNGRSVGRGSFLVFDVLVGGLVPWVMGVFVDLVPCQLMCGRASLSSPSLGRLVEARANRRGGPET